MSKRIEIVVPTKLLNDLDAAIIKKQSRILKEQDFLIGHITRSSVIRNGIRDFIKQQNKG